MSDPWVSGFDAVGVADTFLVGRVFEVERGGTGGPVLTRGDADELGTAGCAFTSSSSKAAAA